MEGLATMDVAPTPGLNPSTARGPIQIDSVLSQLGALFQRTEADLKYVSRKLQSEFSEAYASVGAQTLNPSSAVARLASIRIEMADLATRAQAVEARKRKISSTLLMHAQQGVKNIEALEHYCILSDKSEAVESQNQALNAFQTAYGSGSDTTVGDNQAQLKSSAGSSGSSKRDKDATKSGGNDMKSSKIEFEPVTQDEFDSISDLVKGRIKLTDVNHVYETLFSYFMKPNTAGKSLTTKDMVQMGLKVTGQSGEAKLKVLRQLNLINLSKRDNSVQIKF